MTASFVGALLAGSLSCAHETPPPPRPQPPAVAPPPVAAPIRARLPEWTYWLPIDAPIANDATRAPEPPFDDARIVREGGMEARWKAAPASLRDAVLRLGFAVLPQRDPTATRIAAMYEQLRAERAPFVVTIDALVFYAHVALDRARAEVEAEQVAPLLDALLRRLDARLAADARDAHADVAPAYTVARGVVAVALALANPTYAATGALADTIAKEKALVLAHAGTTTSPLLGVPVDYSITAPRGLADKDDVRLGYYRAAAWLAQAPLILAGRGEPLGAKVSVALARTHARAALLLARLVDHDVDGESAAAFERLGRLSRFLGGPADDLTLADVGREVAREKLAPNDAAWIANIARVDHLRHEVARAHATRLFDGAGTIRVDDVAAEDAPREAGRIRATPSVRLFGGRAASDGEAMQRLVFPSVGAATAREHPPQTARDGIRALPTGVDVLAWLGAAEAREVLREAGDDAFAGYDAELERLRGSRPPADAVARHESVYASALELVAAIAGAERSERVLPAGGSAAWRRRKLDAALSAWSDLRHDALSFTRLPLAKSATADPPRSAAAVGASFVEPCPEAIAALLGMLRQATRGLTALNALGEASPARSILHAVDDLVATSLGIALREANDEPLSPRESDALAAMPARFADLEARVALTGIADTPLAIDVHTDLGPARALEEAVGEVEELYVVVQEPRTRRLVLAIGASLPHYELAQPAALRLTDAAWRARLQAGSAPPRAPYASAFVVERAPDANDVSAGKNGAPASDAARLRASADASSVAK